MVISAEHFDHIVGVDTHARSHTYCLLHCRTSAVICTATFPTTEAGMKRALSWIHKQSTGRLLAAIEGTSSYGASITAVFVSHGIEVTEVSPAAKTTHVNTGKSDSIDAEAAARSTLGQHVDRLAKPRRTGDREALRVLLASRSLIDQQRTANRNALNALVRSTDLGIDARRALTNAQLRSIAAWRIRQAETSTPEGVGRQEARRLAKTVLEQTKSLARNNSQLADISQRIAPGLQDLTGVGPVSAAIILCAYSHKGRVRSEAAFAALGGVAPLQASSGNSSRHRLSRSGDRQLNRALDTIVRTRMMQDPDTAAYVSRRRSEGRTNREIRRCLKRYVARSIFRQLESTAA